MSETRPPALTLEPIGLFRAGPRHPYEARRQGAADRSDETAVIELFAGRQFEQALEDLEGFSRVWVLFHFHENPHWHPKVLPPRGPRQKRGVFATRSPYRPNPIGLSCVELVRVEGRKLYVKSFDLLDGTPVLDIKPYVPYADSFPEARIGWLEGIEAQAFGVELEPEAERRLTWLEANGVGQIRHFVRAQLEFDPTDSERKRVGPLARPDHYRLAYRTWRIDFALDGDARLVRVMNVHSGYTPAQLASDEDRYRDFAIHRAFRAVFPHEEREP